MRAVPPRPLVPPVLACGPFRARDAYDAGLSRRQLQSKIWQRLFGDVFVLRAYELSDADRVRALALALPSGALVTGLTAAWVYGVWSPRPGRPVPLCIAHPVGTRGALTGVRHRQLVVEPVELNELDGLAITSPYRTCFDLIRDLPVESTVRWPTGMRDWDLIEGTVWVDAFIGRELITQIGLLKYANERPGWPGVKRVRRSVEMSHPRAESPMETRLRTVIVLGGLTVPEVNPTIRTVGGAVLGRPDLYYRRALLGLEYDGRYHDEDSRPRRTDAARTASSSRVRSACCGTASTRSYGRRRRCSPRWRRRSARTTSRSSPHSSTATDPPPAPRVASSLRVCTYQAPAIGADPQRRCGLPVLRDGGAAGGDSGRSGGGVARGDPGPLGRDVEVGDGPLLLEPAQVLGQQ